MEMSKQDFNIFLETLLKKIGVTGVPLLVPVHPESYSRLNDCFPNVEEKIKRDGGEITYGWLIHFSYSIIEAERHAVWKSLDGEYIDITPNGERPIRTLFYIDNSWKYVGKSQDNVRLNTTGNKVVDDYILIAETISELYLTGYRNSEGLDILLQPIFNQINSLKKEMKNLGEYFGKGAKEDTICYCGRPFKYKDCHGLNLTADMKETVIRAKKLVSNNKESL